MQGVLHCDLLLLQTCHKNVESGEEYDLAVAQLQMRCFIHGYLGVGSRPQLERGSSRSKNEVVHDLVLWEPKHGERSVGGQARTFVDLLEVDTQRGPQRLLASSYG